MKRILLTKFLLNSSSKKYLQIKHPMSSGQSGRYPWATRLRGAPIVHRWVRLVSQFSFVYIFQIEKRCIYVTRIL